MYLLRRGSTRPPPELSPALSHSLSFLKGTKWRRESNRNRLACLLSFHMQIYANPCASRHWPQIARRKCCKYQIFLLIFKISLLPQHLPKLKRGRWKKKHLGDFLINMQMQAIRFVGWIELISATSFACAVITNYRQASDRQLRPRMSSNGPFTSRGIVESTRTVSWKKAWQNLHDRFRRDSVLFSTSILFTVV